MSNDSNDLFDLDQLFMSNITNTSSLMLFDSINGTNHSVLLEHFIKQFASKTSNVNLTVIIIYSLIAIVSLFGNLLVCYVMLKNKIVRTKTNILMANIALSGLMITIFNIPFNIARLVLNNWPFGLFLCKLLPATQVTSV